MRTPRPGALRPSYNTTSDKGVRIPSLAQRMHYRIGGGGREMKMLTMLLLVVLGLVVGFALLLGFSLCYVSALSDKGIGESPNEPISAHVA